MVILDFGPSSWRSKVARNGFNPVVADFQLRLNTLYTS